MAGNDVKLLGSWPSPFVVRVRIALKMKSVDYEYLENSLLESKSELLLKSNPVHKKFPVLIHSDKPICESLIILQYIDEFWSSGPSILPSDPYDRSVARFWAAYVDDKWIPALRRCALGHDEEGARKEVFEQVKEGLIVLEDAYQKCSKGKSNFFGGDEIGYVDITLGSIWQWLIVIQKMSGVKLLDEDKLPGLFKWGEVFCSHDAVKEFLRGLDELAEFANQLKAKLNPPSAT